MNRCLYEPTNGCYPVCGDDNECKQRNDERRQTAHPYVNTIKSVAVGTFRQQGEQVVAPQPERLQQVADNASVGTVGCQ